MTNAETSKNQYNCFEEAENYLNFTLKDNVKEILVINGFDNKVVIGNLEESDFEKIELYLRNEYHHLLSEGKKSEIYGLYKEYPERFKILSGTRKQISLISKYYKLKYATTKSNASTSTDFYEDIPIALPQSSKDVRKINEIDTNMPTVESEMSVIMKAITSWLKTKVNKDQWSLFETKCESFQLKLEKGPGKQLFASVICFCGKTCKIQKVSKKDTCQPRWIYSNIHKHLLSKHINASTALVGYRAEGKYETKSNTQLIGDSITLMPTSPSCFDKKSITIKEDKRKEKTITDFFTTMPRASLSLSKNTSAETESSERKEITILQNISLLPPCDRHTDNCSNMLGLFVDSKNNTTSKDVNLTGKEFSKNSKQSEISECSTQNPFSKWKLEKYQRHERSRRKRDNIVNNQLLITNFFPILNELSNVFGSNPELLKHMETSENCSLSNQNVSSLLQKLCEISIKNSQKSKHHHSYDNVIKKLGLYLFYIGGRLLYEVLYANLKHTLPAISTLNRFVQNENKYFDEGSFDFENLKVFLDERNLPLLVWIAEDGTRITGKIEYNSRSNTIMGFALPLQNGVPVKDAYIAKSSKIIEEYFLKCPRANYAYVIMAQPLSENAPAYCLSIYGTDNTFTYKDVLQRWKYMEQEANRHGIKIIGFSSDGDTRLLKAMRSRIKLPSTSDLQETEDSELPRWPWFETTIGETRENSLDNKNNPGNWQCFIQDEIHIGTKLRNRLLKSNIHLPMGNFTISAMHIRDLVDTQPKDKHFLTLSDINPVDRMNFRSVEKITSLEVLQLLKGMSDAEGTVSYLKVIRYILNAFLPKNISLEKRLYYIWYAVFYFRIWRNWIKRHDTYKVKDNFITDNAYLCVEINAHNLIKLVCIFRENNFNSDMFCPWLFSSQSCEKIFRAARSMTTTMSTVVNFSIKDIIERIGRIKVVNNILEDLKDIILFPRERKTTIDNKQNINFNQFTNEFIGQIVEEALDDARKDLEDLGICVEAGSWNHISIKMIQNLEDDDIDYLVSCDENKAEVKTENKMFQNFVYDKQVGTTDSDSDSAIKTTTSNVEPRVGGSNLKDYSDRVNTVAEDSQFLQINLENGKTAVVKKSTYCWLLEEEKGRVSSDRLRRFMVPKRGSGNKSEHKMPFKKKKKVGHYMQSRLGHNENSTTSDEEEVSISLDDSTDMETDTEDTAVDDDHENKMLKSKPSQITLEVDKYYAVFYEEQWFLGRITGQIQSMQHSTLNSIQYKIQFLRQDLDSFVWPKRQDIATVEHKYIFYGPINLLGNGPFQISRRDNITIKNLYKTLKKDFV